jgi:hypothetical protein
MGTLRNYYKQNTLTLIVNFGSLMDLVDEEFDSFSHEYNYSEKEMVNLYEGIIKLALTKLLLRNQVYKRTILEEHDIVKIFYSDYSYDIDKIVRHILLMENVKHINVKDFNFMVNGKIVYLVLYY